METKVYSIWSYLVHFEVKGHHVQTWAGSDWSARGNYSLSTLVDLDEEFLTSELCTVESTVPHKHIASSEAKTLEFKFDWILIS